MAKTSFRNKIDKHQVITQAPLFRFLYSSTVKIKSKRCVSSLRIENQINVFIFYRRTAKTFPSSGDDLMKEILIKVFVEARLEIPINSILLTLTKPYIISQNHY